MSDLWEVVVEADEPWHDGVRIGFAKAVLAAAGSPLWVGTEIQVAHMDYAVEAHDVDADATFSEWFSSYQGFGTNVHENADGYCFTDLKEAQTVADTFRDHLAGTGATVKIWRMA